MLSKKSVAAVALLTLVWNVVAHGDGHEGMNMDMEMASEAATGTALPRPSPTDYDLWDIPSYAGLSSHRSSMVAHVAFMVLAWFFVLPVGTLDDLSPS